MPELSIDQEFALIAFRRQIADLNREEAISLLALLYQENLDQRNRYTRIIRHNWGIEIAAEQMPE